MANVQPSTEKKTFPGKPNQLVAYSEKTPEWFQQNCDYLIRNSWGIGNATQIDNMQQYYDVYNNRFPMKWFSHITDPLSAKKEQHKKFPAKIRPINILRTNVDLLINELTQRPFVYQVTNTGEAAYNEYTEQLQKQLVNNLTQHFVMAAQQAAEAGQVPGMQPVEVGAPEIPEKLKERFQGSYKDNQAIRGQRWMERTLDQTRFLSKRSEMMKDYLISGYTMSKMELVGGEVQYDRVSPLELRYGGSPNITFIKDASWAVHREYLTVADATERFCNSLSSKSVRKLYDGTGTHGDVAFQPSFLYDYLKSSTAQATDLVAVYHTVWRGKKMVKILSYPDPTTNTMEELEVDEDYPVDKFAGETARVEYRDEIYQCYRLNDDIYAEEGPVTVQCEGNLPYNGRAFSDTHSENISILAMGLPFQLMVMIINWTMERLIAKSKGKILLMDVHAIPDHGDWDEEKFFYYAEALGYGLLDRNKRNVDKSWNQYQVLDLSMYEQIKQLIDLQNHFRQMWDDILGITMPRKGQTFASSSPTNNQASLFQSNVITDNIYTSFEEFIHEDLNNLLEYSKIATSDGTKALYTSDMFDTMLLELDPTEYCNAALGIMVRTSAKEQRKLNELKSYMQEMLQNGVKPSTIMEIILTENVAELRTKLKHIEAIQAEAEKANANSVEELKAAEAERARQFKIFENELAKDLMNAEWDRKDENTMVKGEYDLVAFSKSMDNDADGVDDGAEIETRVLARLKLLKEERLKLAELDTKKAMQDKDLMSKAEDRASKERIAERDAQVKMKNKVSGEK
jgi:alkylhydroperoxidase/carboxymuconolactone decarboxylase family protein YurZ